jgi:hypothetical protein
MNDIKRISAKYLLKQQYYIIFQDQYKKAHTLYAILLLHFIKSKKRIKSRFILIDPFQQHLRSQGQIRKLNQNQRT